MDEILRFLVNYEAWIYAILGIGGLIYLRNVLQAIREWRSSAFGLEKENARYRFSIAMTVLLVFILLAATEFFIVSFFIPNRPRSTVLATPTLDLLASPTVTLPSGTQPAVTPTGPITTQTVVVSEGCTAGSIEWSYPKEGNQVKGTIELKGTVNVSNLGFYKFEYSSAGSSNWVTIAANKEKKVNQSFDINWNTANINPGDYRLRIVVADNENKILPACVINIRIVSP